MPLAEPSTGWEWAVRKSVRHRWARYGWLLAPVVVASLAAGMPTRAQPAAGVRVVRSDPSGVSIQLRMPMDTAASLLAEPIGGWLDGPGVLSVDDCGLPRIGLLIGVPPGVDISLAVQSAPPVVLSGAPAGGAQRTASSGNGCRPPAAAIEGQAWLRELRVVQLTLRPLARGSAVQGLVLRPEIVADLNFEGTVAADGGRPDPEWEPLLARSVANWESARAWRLSQGNVAPPTVNPLAGSGAWKVAVRRTGWQSLAVTNLTQTGLPPGTPPEAIRLYDRGREIPLQITGGEDGRLEGQDRIAFYGQGLDTRYTDTNIYWLDVVRSGSGVRIPRQPAAPGSGETLAAFTETLRLEEDSFYDGRTAPLPEEDGFYWRELRPGTGTGSLRIAFDLAGLQAGPAQLRLRLKGASAAEHRLRVLLNGQPVAEERWSGTIAHRIGVERSAEVEWRETGNEVTLESVGDADSVLLVDWLEVDYPRDFRIRGSSLEFTAEVDAPCQIEGLPSKQVEIFDVTSAEAPIRLEGAIVGGAGPYSARFQVLGGRRYLVVPEGGHQSPAVTVDAPDDLTAPAAADIIVLTPQELRMAAVTLRTYRMLQGFRVRVVDLQDAFDAFSDGEAEPAAIRALVAGAFVWWRAPAPSYLVLLGDGHVDYRGFTTAAPWRVLVDLVEDDFGGGEIPSDNAFATISGNDVLPDLAVGRLSVSTAEEAARAVDRLQAYERQGPATWHSHAALFADDGPAEAAEGTFGELAAYLQDGFPQGFEIDSLVLGTAEEPSAATMRARIAEVLDEGRCVLAFLGEGQREEWALEPVWTTADAAALRNANLPVMLELTAGSGDFGSPTPRSLAEVHSAHPVGGAIASWASAGRRVGAGHEILARAWLQGVYEDRLRGGAAATAAKIALFAADPTLRDLIRGFNWLGDPTLALVGTLPRDPASPTPLGSPSATGTSTETPTGTSTPQTTAPATASPTSPLASATWTTAPEPTASATATETAVEPQPSPTATATASLPPSATATTGTWVSLFLPRLDRNWPR